jgi:antagonist of KipI
MLRVRRPGALTTVQDLGRAGLGRMGVSPSGAMDPLSLRVANSLVGNAPGAAALELTGPGVELLFEEAAWIALAGADLAAKAGPRPIAPWQAHRIEAGEVLAFGGRTRGARAYVAVSGGLRVPSVMGSASTDLDARLGGLAGAPLRRGDAIPLGAGAPPPPRSVGPGILRFYANAFELAVVVADDAPEDAVRVLLGNTYRVSSRSSRMGFRLEGAPVPVTAAAEAISEAIAPGALQVTADGQPILLMADRQTVGGYPVLAHLARAHVPKAAQLFPGDEIRLRPITVVEAQAMARELEAAVGAL